MNSHPFGYTPTNVSGTIDMEAAGFYATFNMPVATKSAGQGNGEYAQGLPPYERTTVYPVVGEHAPQPWFRASKPNEASFAVEVKPGRGMWLDFNRNDSNPHHVAVLISVQGINPITGLNATPKLEKYQCCPIHKQRTLNGDRVCSDCGFKWPNQNFIATTSTPSGMLWLDGFRNDKGEVRQWIFTQEEGRGVAEAIIGAERTPSIGIAFFRSRAPKPAPVYRSRRLGYGGDLTLESLDSPATLSASRGMRSRSFSPEKSIEVAAGAKIRQEIHTDHNSLDFWEETPAGLIILNYSDGETMAAYLEELAKHQPAGSFLGKTGVRVGA